MCVQGGQQTRPLPPLPRPPPLPREGVPVLRQEIRLKRTKKVNTLVLELVCLVTEQGQQQIFSFQAGQPGGSSRNQISSSKYVLACTPLKHSCTVIYKYVLVCTVMYCVVPSCTVMYRDIPVLVCTGMY